MIAIGFLCSVLDFDEHLCVSIFIIETTPESDTGICWYYIYFCWHMPREYTIDPLFQAKVYLFLVKWYIPNSATATLRDSFARAWGDDRYGLPFLCLCWDSFELIPWRERYDHKNWAWKNPYLYLFFPITTISHPRFLYVCIIFNCLIVFPRNKVFCSRGRSFYLFSGWVKGVSDADDTIKPAPSAVRMIALDIIEWTDIFEDDGFHSTNSEFDNDVSIFNAYENLYQTFLSFLYPSSLLLDEAGLKYMKSLMSLVI